MQKFCDLTLLLLVLRVLANHHDLTFSLDDLALIANLFDGRLNFHCFIPFLSENYFTFFSR